MTEHNVTFYDKDGLSYPFEDTNSDVSQNTYVKVTVTGGIWIFYKKVKFNDSIAGGGPKDIIIIQQPVTQKVLLFSPGSIFRCQDDRDSCTVFEHSQYGGHSKLYHEGVTDVSPDFPTTGTPGASSIIIWPNKDWQLYKTKNYQGGGKVVTSDWYPTAECMGFPNDKLLSLRPS